MPIETATAMPCDSSPKSGSIRSAIAGSPRKPMPSEASVIPNWQADRYWLRSSSQDDRPGRAAVALVGQLLEPRPARADERELGRDEEPVRQDEEDDRDEQERGHVRAAP